MVQNQNRMRWPSWTVLEKLRKQEIYITKVAKNP